MCDRACLMRLTFCYAPYFFHCLVSSPPNTDGALGSSLMLQGLCKRLPLPVPWLPGTVLLLWRRWNYKIGGRSVRETRLRSISLRWRGSLNDTYSFSECVLQISELFISLWNLLSFTTFGKQQLWITGQALPMDRTLTNFDKLGWIWYGILRTLD